MRSVRLFVTSAIVVAVAGFAYARSEERAMSQLEIAIACAPPTSFDTPVREDGRVLHLIGAQETTHRSLFAKSDLLVIDAGTTAGVQLDQQYFVRRPIFFGTNRRHPQSVATLGWIRVVAANDTTALASVVHMCNGMAEGDYLEPFVEPTVSAELVRADSTGNLDFTTLGRVVVGPENRGLGGTTSLMLIDRGSEQGSVAGERFAVYRELKAQGGAVAVREVPLASIGEAVVVSVGRTMSLAWITKSRDAVVPGDYVVPRK